MATLSAVVVDTKGMEKTLRDLRNDQVPYAMGLAVGNLAWDTIRVEKLEMLDVFDRPKPFVVGGLRMLKSAKKKDPSAVIGFTDTSGRFGNRTENIVRTHIRGEARGTKGVESLLRAAGFLRANEYIVAGEAAALDRYGNVSLATHRKMIESLRTGGSPGRGKRYFINKAGRGRAIYAVQGKRGKPKPVWYITTDRPDYNRRFDFYGEAQRHAAKYGPYFAQQAMRKALRTARPR